MFKNIDDAKATPARIDDASPKAAPAYREPRIFDVGKAVDLLQNTSYGAYEDRSTGHKWNR